MAGTTKKQVSLFLFCILFLLPVDSKAQNLLNERIRKIAGKQQSVFLEKGIFHGGEDKLKATLNGVRHSYSTKQVYERIVFDFDGKKIPRIYGHLGEKENKIYMDFFLTKIGPKVGAVGHGQFMKSIDFYPISDEMLSIEIGLNKKSVVEVFYLENPGRVVLDVKPSL